MVNKTIVFPEPGEVIIEERPIPEPEEDEVLIRTEYSLISIGTELTLMSGEYPDNSRWEEYGGFPYIPGYDNIGVVEDVGDNIEHPSVGDRVATQGEHAAYVCVPSTDCHPVPSSVSGPEASFFTIAEIAMNGIRRGDLTWGEQVVVYGLGLLGQFTVRAAQIAGARPILGVDPASDRRNLLPDVNHIIAVDPKVTDPETVCESTTGRQADIIVEATGNAEAIPPAFNPLRNQGRFVVLSTPNEATMFNFHDRCNSPSYTIIGANISSHPDVATPQNPWTRRRHSELFFEWLETGTMSVDQLITHLKPPERAPEVYEMLQSDRTQALGVVFEW